MLTLEHIDSISKEFSSKLDQANDLKSLEQIRIEFLGKKGKITLLLRGLGDVPQEERSSFGQKINQLKNQSENLFKDKAASLSSEESKKPAGDWSLPGLRPSVGRLHPLTQTVNEILDIFKRMGFEAIDGREVETEFYNFTALNIPLDHPSRDAFDTFYTPHGNLLRSQTSTVQIRMMENHKPPFKIVAPGRVYRPDTVDATHSFMFHQIEGLLIDEKTTFSDLKGVLSFFLKELYGANTEIRFRPHFFPFTEPSVEVDMKFSSKKGKEDWIEILGAGCVHPNVLESAGISSKKYQGFAFGLGVERMTMLKYGINDIRHFFENDIRFLNQF